MEDRLLTIATGVNMPVWGTIAIAIAATYKTEISTYIKTFVYGEKAKLLSHRFFSKMSYDLYSLDNMVFHNTNKVRDELTKDFIRIKIEYTVKAMRKFIEEKGEERDPKTLCELFIAEFKRQNNTSNQLAIDSGIPRVFIEKYLKIRRNKWSRFYSDVENFFYSPIYRNNIFTTIRVLDSVCSLFDTFLLDAETTISRINGELNNEMYNGQIIGPGEKTNYLFECDRNEH